jgi:hypothetical protein
MGCNIKKIVLGFLKYQSNRSDVEDARFLITKKKINEVRSFATTITTYLPFETSYHSRRLQSSTNIAVRTSNFANFVLCILVSCDKTS